MKTRIEHRVDYDNYAEFVADFYRKTEQNFKLMSLHEFSGTYTAIYESLKTDGE